MIIFDPAMCCSTGICGPSVDSELLRVSTVLNNLNKNGVVVKKYNLTSNPQDFVDNNKIQHLLKRHGVEILPVTILDEKVIKTKQYPTNAEFCKLLKVPEECLKTKVQIKDKGCGCKGGCC